MVTITHPLEVNVVFEGSSEDGAEAVSISICTGRDWKTKTWTYSPPIPLPFDVGQAIAALVHEEVMEVIREEEGEQAAEAEQQKADDRWSERGLNCD